MEEGKSIKNKKEEIVAIKPELVGESFASVENPLRLQNGTSSSSGLSVKYPNLMGGELPFQYTDGSFLVNSDAALLCQKAYYRISAFRNAIDMMSELASSTELFFEGGNSESRDFFEAWWKRIGGVKTREQFNRELFRSGSIYMYRVDGTMTPESAKKIKQIYARAASIDIPLRYIFLNPVNIGVINTLNFDNPLYYRILNKVELNLIKNSGNPDSQELYKSLPTAIKEYFDGAGLNKPVPIDPKKLHVVFYKKQDYEPFAVPIGYSVLDSLELKLAMQKSDAVISRTVEYAMLVVTMGAKKDEGGTNPESLRLLKEAFKSGNVGRVLISDYTTKAEFVIPDLNKIISPEKYKVVNEDIATGLVNIFFATEGGNIANLAGKLRVFSEKINSAQNLFVNEFINPEIKRISRLLGFRNYPSARLGKFSLEDPSQMMRVYAQLLQLGVLTPKDGLEAMETGIFPNYEDLHLNQEALKLDKDKGLFQPLQGGPFSQNEIVKLNHEYALKTLDKQSKIQQKSQPANPPNSNSKPALEIKNAPNQKKVPQPTGRPPGAKASISMAKLVDNIKLHGQLIDAVTLAYQEKNGSSDLTQDDKNNILTLVRSVTECEIPKNWLAKAKKYIDKPKTPSLDKIIEMEEFASEYDVGLDTASILYHSIVED